MNVTILHEYGARKHFAGLNFLEQAGMIQLQWGEFNLHVQLGKAAFRRNNSAFFRFMHNIKLLKELTATRDRILIVGAAPYDFVVYYLKLLEKRHKLIYFTSWPYWQDGVHVKKPFLPNTVNTWRDFLKDKITVCVTNATRESISDLVGNAYHIPHGVNMGVFYPNKSEINNKGNVRILFVGQFSKRKGIETLISIVKKKLISAEFWFVGRGPYEKEIKELHNKKLARYFGYIRNEERLAEIYRESDILVLPSLDDPGNGDVENFGIVLIEAMASGIPVVATNCVGPMEIVQHKKTGLLVSQSNTKDLVDALQTLVANPSWRKEMGKRAVSVCKEKYDLPVVGEKWMKVLNKISH